MQPQISKPQHRLEKVLYTELGYNKTDDSLDQFPGGGGGGGTCELGEFLSTTVRRSAWGEAGSI